jgi:hypothetical protein
VALQSLYGPWPPHAGGFIIYFRHLVELVWTCDQPVAKASTHTGQHNTETHIHASFGIQTHDPSNQTAKTYALDRADTGIDNFLFKI